MACLGRYTFFVMTPSAAFREALSLASRSLQSTAPGAKKARKCQNQEPANTSESRHVKNMRKQRLCQQMRSKQPLATKRLANKWGSAVSRLWRILQEPILTPRVWILEPPGADFRGLGRFIGSLAGSTFAAKRLANKWWSAVLAEP